MVKEIKLGDNWSLREDDVSGDLNIQDRINTTDVFSLTTGGDVSLAKNLDLSGNSLTTDGATVSYELKVPVYSDNANAIQDSRSVWFNDGSNQSSGYYGYDGSAIVGPLTDIPGQWQEDGSGNIVPIDGEVIGDGSQSANLSDIDVQTVSTGSLTVDGKESDYHLKLLKSAVETTATTLSEDFSIPNADSRYKLEFSVSIRSNITDLTLNYVDSGTKNTDAIYDYRSISDTGVSTTQGDSKYVLASPNDDFHSFSGTVYYDNRPGGTGFPNIRADIAGTTVNDVLFDFGTTSSNINPDAINLETTEDVEYEMYWYEVPDQI